MTELIRIQAVPLPMSIKGFVKQDLYGYYYIYINDALSDEAKRDAVKHELSHIARHDLSFSGSITEMEKENETLAKRVRLYHKANGQSA